MGDLSLTSVKATAFTVACLISYIITLLVGFQHRTDQLASQGGVLELESSTVTRTEDGREFPLVVERTPEETRALRRLGIYDI